MKTKVRYTCFLCALVILISFFLSSFNSIRNGFKFYNHSKNHVSLNAPVDHDLTEDLIFEEQVNESETELDTFAGLNFLIVPFLTGLSFTDHSICIFKPDVGVFKHQHTPLYLNIRVFRI